jgi:hypothetical protein
MNTVCTYTYIYLSMPLLAYISVLDFVGMYFWDSNPYSCDHTYPLARFTHTVLLFLLRFRGTRDFKDSICDFKAILQKKNSLQFLEHKLLVEKA